MAVILVDYENVRNLKGVDLLNSEDTFVIFYSNNCKRIKKEYLEPILKSQCNFRTVKLKKTGRNALDFYIAAECGLLAERGVKEIGILSQDKGYNATIDFFDREPSTDAIKIFKSKSLESLFLQFSGKSDKARKLIINAKQYSYDLDIESAKLEERNRILGELKLLLAGTAFENKTCEIIDFLTASEAHSKKELYVNSLHSFGKKEGTEIYNFLKDRITLNALAKQ